MATKSAGILVYRRNKGGVEFLLVHPGGPFWAKKDLSAWSIPKGEFLDEEDALAAARREFEEEIGQPVSGDFLELTPIKQKSGKTVYAWAVEADIDTTNIQSNTFEMEWPPKSGKMKRFPEIDKAEWFTLPNAKEKINESQYRLIEETLLLMDK